jgi:hypothetical protein
LERCEGLPIQKNTKDNQKATNKIVTHIDFDALNKDPAFTLPEKITASTLTQALANCAINHVEHDRRESIARIEQLNTVANNRKESIQTLQNEGKTADDEVVQKAQFEHGQATKLQQIKLGDDFTIVGVELSTFHPSHYLSYLNPANFTPFIVAALSIGFILKAFSPTLFLAAAPSLMGIALGCALIAGVALIAFVAKAITLDIKYQTENGNLEKKKGEWVPHKQEIKFLDYLRGVPGRIIDWGDQHSHQVKIGLFTTGLMLVIAGAAITYAINSSLLSEGLKLAFDFIANILSSGFTELAKHTFSFLAFSAGSVICHVLTAGISATFFVVILDGIRRAAVALYEAHWDESAQDFDLPLQKGTLTDDALLAGVDASRVTYTDVLNQLAVEPKATLPTDQLSQTSTLDNITVKNS